MDNKVVCPAFYLIKPKNLLFLIYPFSVSIGAKAALESVFDELDSLFDVAQPRPSRAFLALHEAIDHLPRFRGRIHSRAPSSRYLRASTHRRKLFLF